MAREIKSYIVPLREYLYRKGGYEKVDTLLEGGEMERGWEVCEIKRRACETKFIPLARRNRAGRALGEVSGGRERFRDEGRREASERWQKRHKSDGHPKVPRNTKQKKDRARAGDARKRISERPTIFQ